MASRLVLSDVMEGPATASRARTPADGPPLKQQKLNDNTDAAAAAEAPRRQRAKKRYALNMDDLFRDDLVLDADDDRSDDDLPSALGVPGASQPAVEPAARTPSAAGRGRNEEAASDAEDTEAGGDGAGSPAALPIDLEADAAPAAIDHPMEDALEDDDRAPSSHDAPAPGHTPPQAPVGHSPSPGTALSPVAWSPAPPQEAREDGGAAAAATARLAKALHCVKVIARPSQETHAHALRREHLLPHLPWHDSAQHPAFRSRLYVWGDRRCFACIAFVAPTLAPLPADHSFLFL